MNTSTDFNVIFDYTASGRVLGTFITYLLICFACILTNPCFKSIKLIYVSAFLSCITCFAASVFGFKLYLFYGFGISRVASERLLSLSLNSAFVYFLAIILFGVLLGTHLHFVLPFWVMRLSPGLLESVLSLLSIYILFFLKYALFGSSQSADLLKCWHILMFVLIGLGMYSIIQEVFVSLVGKSIGHAFTGLSRFVYAYAYGL